MENTYTENLADFGNREKLIAGKLLTTMATQGLPYNFNNDGVKVAMNMSSGYVFLTNEDFQVAMFNGEKLESWYSCPNCGNEGFFEDIHKESKGLEDGLICNKCGEQI